MDKLSSFGRGLKTLEDFSEYELIRNNLGGAVAKVCILKDSKIHMLKFDKDGETKNSSEYISMLLCRELGYSCQEVDLVIYNSEIGSCIELFNQRGEFIHHYYDINDSSLSEISEDVRDLPYTLDYILEVLTRYRSIGIPKESIIKSFVEMCLFDTVIGNFDRHWGNWGFIGRDKNYRISPLFDSGSSMLPKIREDECTKALSNKNIINSYVYDIPKSQIKKTSNKKFRYDELILELISKEYDYIILEFIEKFSVIDLDKIFSDCKINLTLGSDKIASLKLLINLRFCKLVKDVYKCKKNNVYLLVRFRWYKSFSWGTSSGANGA
ncbi:MAG: HipA domain-containing protein [Anaeroplasmataceae bacterium]